MTIQFHDYLITVDLLLALVEGPFLLLLMAAIYLLYRQERNHRETTERMQDYKEDMRAIVGDQVLAVLSAIENHRESLTDEIQALKQPPPPTDMSYSAQLYRHLESENAQESSHYKVNKDWHGGL